MTYIAITIVGGKAPFSMIRKDRVSKSSRCLHVKGFKILLKVLVHPNYTDTATIAYLSNPAILAPPALLEGAIVH